ncbi:MAG: zinc ribbon domain-containing protein [Candidatus Acidiferrales bacterium]
MNTFRDELRVIPRFAWYLGIMGYLVLSNLAFFILLPQDPNLRQWPFVGKVAFAYGIFLIILVLIWLVGYVHGDAKRRGMRYVMWTWLAALIPDGIGVILYFVLRDPLPAPCPHCSYVVRASFVFCPHCGTAMQPTCPNCGRAVEAGWANCPHCGTKLPAPSHSAA